MGERMTSASLTKATDFVYLSCPLYSEYIVFKSLTTKENFIIRNILYQAFCTIVTGHRF